jgi:hypothetical protein
MNEKIEIRLLTDKEKQNTKIQDRLIKILFEGFLDLKNRTQSPQILSDEVSARKRIINRLKDYCIIFKKQNEKQDEIGENILGFTFISEVNDPYIGLGF